MSYEQTAFCGAVGRGEEIFWVNPAKKPYEAVKASLPFSRAQIEDAASRLSRFAPFLQIKFPAPARDRGDACVASYAVPRAAWRKTSSQDGQPSRGGGLCKGARRHL